MLQRGASEKKKKEKPKDTRSEREEIAILHDSYGPTARRTFQWHGYIIMAIGFNVERPQPPASARSMAWANTAPCSASLCIARNNRAQHQSHKASQPASHTFTILSHTTRSKSDAHLRFFLHVAPFFLRPPSHSSPVRNNRRPMLPVVAVRRTMSIGRTVMHARPESSNRRSDSRWLFR